ncbi:collagen alpha-1(III) chain-like [Rhinopithecus roxellana]|uniref:collagen alpha-1(III) chain-like n=1 Tax=Rhinopithecus roxellana TaxID=61622 RepID=UPI0012375791|nr:collagen alpha-1(III) chain-like [Rhinopithecus roxellana]
MNQAAANTKVCGGAGKASGHFNSTRKEHSDALAKLVAKFPLRHRGVRGKPPPARGPGSARGCRHAWLLPTRERRSPQGGPGRGKRSAARRAAGGPGREEGGLGGWRAVLLFPFALLLPRLGPGVTGKPPEPPGGWLFIARAARASRSPARLTGPLTRLAAGPSPRGCAPDAGDNGLLCVQLLSPPGAGGRGPGEGGGRLPGSPLCRPRAPESMSREGDLSSRGRPLCEPRGAGPVPRASSWGCGDRGAGSAGQVTYPGLRVGGLCLGREEGSRDGC